MTITLTHNGVTYANWQPDNLAAAGVPASVIAAAQDQARRQVAIEECRRRIYAAASVETQLNMAAAAAVAAATPEDQRDPAATALIAAFAAATAWITAMRAAITPAAASDSPADDTHWPPLPPEVAALAEQF